METTNPTRPMTAEEYYYAIEVFEFERPDIVIKPKYIFEFARVYANYRLMFEQEHKPQPRDPFEGAPEWARFRVADMARKEFWASKKPYPYDYGAWYGENCMFQECHDRRLTYSDWKVSLVEKTNK